MFPRPGRTCAFRLTGVTSYSSGRRNATSGRRRGTWTSSPGLPTPRLAEQGARWGEPRDEYPFGMLRVEPRVHLGSVAVNCARLPEAGERATVFHRPYWSLEAMVYPVERHTIAGAAARRYDHVRCAVDFLDPHLRREPGAKASR